MKQKKKNLLRSPTAIVAILFCLMVVFFMLSGASAQQLGEQINAGLNYGTLVGFGRLDLRIVIFRIINVLFGFLGILAIIYILYGGFVWMTSAGNPEKIERAKRIITNAAIGLFIILAAFAIVLFIIRALLSGVLPGQPGGGPRQPPRLLACQNCGALGGCIIEYTLPEAGQRDVARNTTIVVMFKEKMDANTICVDSSGNPDSACGAGGGFNSANISITYQNPADPGGAPIPLLSNEVEVRKVDSGILENRLFAFIPKNYLGDGINHIWHTVRLENGIKKIDAAGLPVSAFATCPTGDHYEWSFEVGTRLDLTPPQVREVFPNPDNEQDVYSPIAAQQAQGSIVVKQQPQPAQPGTSLPITVTESGNSGPNAIVNGGYGCESARIRVDYNGGKFTVTSNPDITGLNDTPPLAIDQLTLGCGLLMRFTDVASLADGQLWEFQMNAPKVADTLTINTKTYQFVTVQNAADEIKIGASQDDTRGNITAVINTDSDTLRVEVAGTGEVGGNPKVDIRAIASGVSGNSIPLSHTGAWADITPMHDGQNEGVNSTRQGLSDQPKNVILKVDFNEAMFPIPVAGEVALSDPTLEVGTLANAADPPFVTVQADMDDVQDGFQDDEYVAGNWEISNAFKTVEFRGAKECGQRNACGEVIYCLPVRANNFTHYKVTVRAAHLEVCADESECRDPNYKKCLDDGSGTGTLVCQKDDGTFYPASEFNPLPDGVVDAARNSLDGNKVRGAEGPKSVYILNPPPASDGQDTTKGDSVSWSFYISDRLEISAPEIVNIEPSINEDFVNLTKKPQATFNKILWSASLRSGRGYRDGLCTCQDTTGNPDIDLCKDATNYTCDATTNPDICFEKQGNDFLCQNNNECLSDTCLNQSYVSIIDPLCTGQGALRRCVGWHVENEGEDVGNCAETDLDVSACVPYDGFSDRTIVRIAHTPLAELVQYGSEMGSGIKDIYQNCFLPSSAPRQPISCVGKPYCCDGQGSTSPCE